MSIDNLQITARVPEITFHVRQAIMKYQGDLDVSVAQAVEAALKNFDYDAIVSTEIDRELRAAVKQVIRRAVSRLLYDEIFAKAVQKEVRAAFTRKP